VPVTLHSLFKTVEGLVAVGTILLAFGTLGVALLTRSTAKATKKLASETRGLVDATAELARVSAEEVEMSRRALQAEVKPLLVDWPANNREVTFARAVDERLFTIPAVNAGAPGLIQRATMHWDEAGAAVSPTTYEGTVTVLALMPGGETEAQFLFPRSEFARLDQLEWQGKFWVEIAYTDASGGQPEVTRFDVYRVTDVNPGGPSRWRVWAVSFRRANEAEPYARAQPANR
jgi:hypothetical protein